MIYFKGTSLYIPKFLTTLDKMGVTQPTDIQQKAIPVLLGLGSGHEQEPAKPLLLVSLLCRTSTS